MIHFEDPWLKDMPAGWAKTRIRNVASLSPSYSQNPPAEDEALTVVPMESLSEDGKINTSTQLYLDEIQSGLNLFEEGDVLFAKITPCMENGKGALVPQMPTRYAFGSTEFHVFRPSPKVNGKFLYYVTFDPTFRAYAADNMKGAAGQKRVTSRFIKDTHFFLPPLPEQERIAAFLDSSCAAIDAAVQAKQGQIETLDDLRKTVKHKIVTNGLRENLPLKDSEIESVGMIPDHWQVKQLRYACEVNYGITLQLEKGQSEGDGVRILTVSNITIDGQLNLEDEYYIDPELVVPDDYLRKGDLLFNWRNGSQYHVGKTAFFNLDGEFTHVSFILRIRCGHTVDPFYLQAFLSVLKDAKVFAGAKDKVNKTFNSTELKRLRIVIPPVEEQKEIAQEVERRSKEIYEAIAVIEKQIDALLDYRKSLIHECVTGQHRV